MIGRGPKFKSKVYKRLVVQQMCLTQCYETGRAAAYVSECLPHALVTRAGEGVGEGRVEEGGGVRGYKVSRRSVRSYQRRQLSVFMLTCSLRRAQERAQDDDEVVY